MLKELNISNMAVIEGQSLGLGKGFTVLTGETGAGKSVLIDSVNMILGHRGDKTLIRHGKKAAVAEAVFEPNSESIKELLEQEGIFDCDGEILVSRSLSSEGKSVCRINGVTVSAAFLKTLGAELINIHGQQDNQKLLSKKFHTDILDKYIIANGGGAVIEGYKNAYGVYADIKKRYDAAAENRQETEKEINYLRFVYDELSAAEVCPGEEAELSERQEILANAKDIYMTLSGAYDILYEGEVNAYSIVSSAVSMMSKISGYSEKLGEISEALGECMYMIKDAAGDARNFRDDCEPDEAALREVDERLALIFDLKRKYKKGADELEAYKEEVREKLESLVSEDIEELEEKLIKARDEAVKRGAALTAEREKYKKVLEERIYSALCDLNMKSARFEIFLNKKELSAGGCEEAEFLMCTAGQGEMRPMEKIASGGELSRIMLAIKYVLADSDECDTLIFDEIDTGVSGISAQAVADKLYALSKTKQVICITHLAQIAAMADNHVLINKTMGEDGIFSTTVSALDYEGRVCELTRIIGGASGSEGVVSAAREMIDFCAGRKNNVECRI